MHVLHFKLCTSKRQKAHYTMAHRAQSVDQYAVDFVVSFKDAQFSITRL
mgnify:CR=1 FL=1